MKMDAAEEAEVALRGQESTKQARVICMERRAAVRRQRVAEIVKARPRPTAPDLAAANVKLAEQTEEGLRRDDVLTHGNGRTCACNFAISLEAKNRPPAVFHAFQYLCGATPARLRRARTTPAPCPNRGSSTLPRSTACCTSSTRARSTRTRSSR